LCCFCSDKSFYDDSRLAVVPSLKFTKNNECKGYFSIHRKNETYYTGKKFHIHSMCVLKCSFFLCDMSVTK
jgi:hypothetical protein